MLLLEHGGADIGGLSFSQDGRMLSVCSRERVSVWNHLTGEMLHQPAASHGVRCARFSSRTVLILAGDTVSRWMPTRGTRPLGIEVERGPVVAMCASRYARVLYLATDDHHAHRGVVLRVQGRGKRYLTVRDNFINSVALKPASDTVAVAARGMLLQWNAMRSKSVARCWTQRIPADQPLQSSLPSISRLGGDGGGEILDVDRNVRCVQYAPDGRQLAVAVQNDVEVWDADDARKLAALHHHDAQVRAVAYSPDGRWLASGGDDKIIVFYDLIRRRAVLRYDWQIGRVRSIAFAPDGLTVAAAGERAVAVWDVEEPSP